jgi:Co/Zn/Cd efflux system component
VETAELLVVALIGMAVTLVSMRMLTAGKDA